MITLIHGDAFAAPLPDSEMIFTDPPFELPGEKLAPLFAGSTAQHLLMFCTMRQALDFYKASGGWTFAFDLVSSHLTPKMSRSYQQPHMLHSNIIYFRRDRTKSAFDRRRVPRSDHYSDEANHYWPSIFHAPKNDRIYKYQKNQRMVNDLLGAFAVESVCDPFAGSGSTGLAAVEHGINAALIEKDASVFEILRGQFGFFDDVIIQHVTNMGKP